MTGIIDNKFLYDFESDIPIFSIARLKELGSQQGYVTYDDILRLFPEAENNIDYMDQIYVFIRNAGILFIEEKSDNETSTGDTTGKEVDIPYDGRAKSKEENYLSNVELLESLCFEYMIFHPRDKVHFLHFLS